jgi:G3E family GTPase
VRADAALVWVEPAMDRALPFRWLVRWRAAGEAAPGARERHPRACASLVGVLSALRTALGVERGAAVRVAGAAVHPSTPLPLRSGRTEDGETASLPSVLGTGAHAPKSKDARTAIPITVITGLLGSGKTTLLSRLLRDPDMGRTAVIINELGEIGLDHELIETSDESFVQLSNGCLCCKVRSDLVLTLRDLAARRAAGTVPAFERVVIETTGLADPAPILHALATDAGVAESYAIEGVVATVDAVTGIGTLARYAESASQAAIADCIVLTKTDVPEANAEELADAIAAINADAPVLKAAGGAIEAPALFGLLASSRARVGGSTVPPAREASPHHLHGIETVSITREAPLHAATLPLFLSALAENCGADLLRVKGIMAIAQAPSTPAVIHGVQHVYHAPAWLERWPSPERRSRIVLIGRRLSKAWPQTLLDLLEAEVADESAHIAAASGSAVA